MIQSHPNAPEGSVTTAITYQVKDFGPADAVLCRNVAPLLSFAFSCLRHDIPCRVAGREIGQGLISSIKKSKAETLPELVVKLNAAQDREMAIALARHSESAAAAIEDKYECLSVLIDNAETVADLLRKIENLFDDKRRDVLTLSTIHKAKGMEWEKVFILDWDLCPCRWAKQPWEQIQERNLQYVAVTRAKLDLIFIKSKAWQESKLASSPN